MTEFEDEGMRNMLVLIEKAFQASVWCREIIDGLRYAARKKRASITICTDINEIEQNEENAIILVGAETDWLNLAITQAKQFGKHPIILSNQFEQAPESDVSRVTEDIFGSMNEIVNLFLGKGIQAVALYAVNPDSASDSFKKEAFFKSNGQIGDVFENAGSLSDCFDRFYEKHRERQYGGIVCTNDFAAISLIRHLKERGECIEKIDIISYSDTLISKCTSPAVSTVRANYKSFGTLAFLIFDCITKNEAMGSMHVSCKWDIIHRETSSPSHHAKAVDFHVPTKQSRSFYGDPELMEMMQIESLLSECDETDSAIITAILDGKKTAEIADECFLTESSLKYRINKMKGICHVDSRSALCDFLRNYITKTVPDPHIS